MAMLPVAADHAYEHKDGAPIVQLMASVFSELRLTEVSGGVEPSAAAGFFSRKGLERIGQCTREREQFLTRTHFIIGCLRLVGVAYTQIATQFVSYEL